MKMARKRRFDYEDGLPTKSPKLSILHSIPIDNSYHPPEDIPDTDGTELYESQNDRVQPQDEESQPPADEVLPEPELPQVQDPFHYVLCIQMYGRLRKNGLYRPLNSTPKAIGSSRRMVVTLKANSFSCLFLNSIHVSIHPKSDVGNFFFVLTEQELATNQKKQFEQNNVLHWDWNSSISWEDDHRWRKELFLTCVKRNCGEKQTKKCFEFCVTFTIRSNSSEVALLSHTLEITPRSHHVEKKTTEIASAFITVGDLFNL